MTQMIGALIAGRDLGALAAAWERLGFAVPAPAAEPWGTRAARIPLAGGELSLCAVAEPARFGPAPCPGRHLDALLAEEIGATLGILAGETDGLIDDTDAPAAAFLSRASSGGSGPAGAPRLRGLTWFAVEPESMAPRLAARWGEAAVRREPGVVRARVPGSGGDTVELRAVDQASIPRLLGDAPLPTVRSPRPHALALTLAVPALADLRARLLARDVDLVDLPGGIAVPAVLCGNVVLELVEDAAA